jgi:argininosuccinate lyase
MKLWDKGINPERSVISFTSESDRITDRALAKWDIAGSMAHAIMLEDAGLISRGEKNELLKALASLFEKEKSGNLVIEDGVEDIHSQIEKELTEMLGTPGKKVHTGRSRNDQVLTAIRLWTRNAIDELAMKTGRLFDELQQLSEKHRDVFLPGYTHMQPAMPSSFGLWFGSWAESLADDVEMLGSARKLVNRNPLGTAAGYGSTLPLNRKLTTDLLDFGDLIYNSAYAGINRGKAELAVASALAMTAQTLNRLSSDICLFMTAEFRFIDFPDELVTGSSIMPQKRNPDVFELIRGRTNLLQILPGQVTALISNLPSGYNRELQLLKNLIFNAFADLGECIEMMILMLGNIIVRKDISENPLYNPVYSTEEANRLVKKGMPFRDAYREVAGKVGKESFRKTSPSDYSHEGSIGNLCNGEIRKIFEERMKVFKSESAEVLVKRFVHR